MIRSNFRCTSLCSWLFLCAFLVSGYSCRKEYFISDNASQAAGSNIGPIRGFRFYPRQNASFINDTISLDISGNRITGRIPYYTNLKSLIPSFETNATSVSVAGLLQESGISVQDFTHPVQYKVWDGTGEITDYVVSVTNFTGLPVIKINTEGDAAITSKEDYVNAHITIDGAGNYGDFEGDMKIKGHGNSTWDFLKKPYKFKLDKKQSLLGEPQDKEWLLLANYTDKTQIRNATAFFMGQISALDWTPHGHFAEVFLNEVYQGTYQLCESAKASESRVNVTDDGYLLEVDQLSRLDPDDVYFNTNKMLVNIKDPEVEEHDEKYNYIMNYVTDAENALFGSNFTDSVAGYAKYLDVPSFVDWYLINEIAKNNDAIFFSSCYMNLTPGGKLKMGPIWDFDIAFGNVNYNGNNSPEGFWVKNGPWMDRLFQDPAFVQKVQQRFSYFKSQKDTILNNINANAGALKWSAIENNNKWQTLYTSTWPNYAISGSYDNEVVYLKNWFNARMDWMESALAGL